MVYCATEMTEHIYMHYENDASEVHRISLTKSGEEPVFCVECCCYDDWYWLFYMDNVSNYEMIKHAIMDAMFECDDIDEVIDELDAQFEEIFGDIVVWNDRDECCCENCNHRDCLN